LARIAAALAPRAGGRLTLWGAPWPRDRSDLDWPRDLFGPPMRPAAEMPPGAAVPAEAVAWRDARAYSAATVPSTPSGCPEMLAPVSVTSRGAVPATSSAVTIRRGETRAR
jgi:hypothetical protein